MADDSKKPPTSPPLSSSDEPPTAPVCINRGKSSCSYYAQPSYKQQLSRWPYDLFPRNAAAQSSSHDHQINNNEITEAARSESEYLDPSEELLPNLIHKPQSFAPSRIPKPVQDLYAAFSCSVGVLFVGDMVWYAGQYAFIYKDKLSTIHRKDPMKFLIK